MSQSRKIARLESRAVIAVGGADWRDFLQNLLTQNVEDLADGDLRFGALLTPQGRLLYDLFIAGTQGGCLLDVAAEHRAALVQRLTIYRLRAKVTIEAVDRPVFALWGGAPEGGEWRPDPRLAELGWRTYDGDYKANAAEAEHVDHAMALGVPGAADWGTDRTFPIEANFDFLNGIDFKKGCFVGQETTSRMKRRGQIKSRMVSMTFDGPAPVETEVLAGTLRAAEITSLGDGRVMALARLDRIEGAALEAGGVALTAHVPPWWPKP